MFSNVQRVDSRANVHEGTGEPEPIVGKDQLLAAMVALPLSLASIGLVVAWMLDRGGFSSDKGTGRFNLHPLSMVLAINFLLTNGILAWRVWPLHHSIRKILHVVCNMCAIGMVGFGLWAVFTMHGSSHCYSAHSWFGLATALLLGSQAILGLVYLAPVRAPDFKVGFLPMHAWLGLATYILAALTVTTGIVNLMARQFIQKDQYQMKPWGHENKLASILGIVTYATLFFTLYAAMPRRNTEYEGAEVVGGGAGMVGANSRRSMLVQSYPYTAKA